MFWKTRLDHGHLQWQTFLAGWLFVSFLERLARFLLSFLRILRTLCLDHPCSSWHLRKTFHGAMGTSKTKMKDEEIPQSIKEWLWIMFAKYMYTIFHSCSLSWTVSPYVALGCFPWPFCEKLLLFPPRLNCLHLTNSRSFAMDILLSLCLRCLSKTANKTLRLSGSSSKPSLSRISVKDRERNSSCIL